MPWALGPAPLPSCHLLLWGQAQASHQLRLELCTWGPGHWCCQLLWQGQEPVFPCDSLPGEESQQWATDSDPCPLQHALGVMKGSDKSATLASEQESLFRHLEHLLVGTSWASSHPNERA